MLAFDLDHALDQPLLKLGSYTLTLEKLVVASVIIALAVMVIWSISQLAARSQSRVGEGRAATVYVAGQVARYVVAIGALAGVISALGVDLSALSLFAGALGVGIGLGLQLDFVRFWSGPGPEQAVCGDMAEGLIEGQDASAHVVDILPFAPV